MAKKWFIAKACTDRMYARSWDKKYKAERALDYRMQQMGWRVVFEDELAALQEEVDRIEIQKVLLR